MYHNITHFFFTKPEMFIAFVQNEYSFSGLSASFVLLVLCKAVKAYGRQIFTDLALAMNT